MSTTTNPRGPATAPARGKTFATCEQCGVQFRIPPSRVGKRRFCGLACTNAWKSLQLSGGGAPWWKPKIAVACAVCGTVREVLPSLVATGKGRFCSPECGNAGGVRHRAAPVPCHECGEPVRRRKGRHRRRRFCSKPCYLAALSRAMSGANNPAFKGQEVDCEQCGKCLVRAPHRLRCDRTFCDLKCYATWQSENVTGEAHHLWRGGIIHDYGPSWRIQRKRALERDGYCCVACGKTREQIGRNPDVHHKVPFRDFSFNRDDPERRDLHKLANRLSNLVSLCRSCHAKAEWGGIDLSTHEAHAHQKDDGKKP